MNSSDDEGSGLDAVPEKTEGVIKTSDLVFDEKEKRWTRRPSLEKETEPRPDSRIEILRRRFLELWQEVQELEKKKAKSL